MLSPSKTLPTTLRRALLGGLCATALIVGGCSGGDKAPAEEITVEALTLDLSAADETALARHFEIQPRAGDEAQTLALLEAAGLSEATYAERVADGANVVYTGWSASNEDGAVTAERVEMIGVHETEDGETTLDRLNISGMTLKGYNEMDGERQEVVDASVAELAVVQPSPGLFADLSDILAARDSGSDTATQAVSSGDDFRALRLAGMKATVREQSRMGELSVSQFMIGNNSEDGLVDTVLERVNFVWAQDTPQDGAEPFVLDMDGLTILDLDTDKLNGSSLSAGRGSVFGLMISAIPALSPTAGPPYRQVDLGRMSVKSDMFDLETDGFEAASDVDRGKTTLRTVLAPMTLTLKDLSSTALGAHMDTFRENGLDEITLRSSSTTVFDAKADRVTYEQGGTDIDGGLRMRCAYSILGLNAASDAIKASGANIPTLDLSTAEDPQEAINTYTAAVEAYSKAQTQANQNIRLENLDCALQDVPGNSLVERGYNVASAITGKPVVVLKGGAKTVIGLSAFAARSDFQRDFMETVGNGLINFIDNPGQTLTISATPDEPVKITSLTGEDGNEPTIKPLNLSVEVK